LLSSIFFEMVIPISMLCVWKKNVAWIMLCYNCRLNVARICAPSVINLKIQYLIFRFYPNDHHYKS
jgi:hypothetical protein